MIKLGTMDGRAIELTEEYFISEVNSYVKFMIDEEGMKLNKITPSMIENEIVVEEKYRLSEKAVSLIEDAIKNFKDYTVHAPFSCNE